jgi:hypothetical protein
MNDKNSIARREQRGRRRFLLSLCVIALTTIPSGFAQNQPVTDSAVQERIRALTDAMERVESQMQESQRELAEIRKQLAALRDSSGAGTAPPAAASDSAKSLADAVANVRETQAVQEAQIATLEQTKVESASKYPLKVSGMILMTAMVNTHGTDSVQTPVVAYSGGGSTGATARQTILGLDGSGPRIFGARSHGDLRIDFSAGAAASGYGNAYSPGVVRLRTAHAELNWDHAQAFFALDRPILSPDSPTSLIAVAEPALAWSGNLWAWNPQFGVSLDALRAGQGTIRIQGALIDTVDAPWSNLAQSGIYSPSSSAESSRWPGVEARLSYGGAQEDGGAHIGVSGLFAPHRVNVLGIAYHSWAGAADFRLPATRFTQLSGSAYYGSALGGLGGGAYKDYVWKYYDDETYSRALDDSGGWLQWKQKAGDRLEFNEAFGIDNVPGHQLLPYATSTPMSYSNLARNRTVTANVIYSPSAYLLFSLEYRHIMSSYVTAPTQSSDAIGLGAGYRF